MESGVGLLQAARGLGQPDPHDSGQQGTGHHRRRETTETHAFGHRPYGDAPLDKAPLPTPAL